VSFSTSRRVFLREKLTEISNSQENKMKNKPMLTMLTICLLALASFMATTAFAGSAHFVGTCTATNNHDGTVTVTGKEAGLGGESINVTTTVIAECINGGDKHPKATNKTANTTSTPVTVHNGKADIDITVPVVTSPRCSAPMTLAIDSCTIYDSTNSLGPQNCTVVQ
jgi:hypothetical protein